jgi:hypothetical protein
MLRARFEQIQLSARHAARRRIAGRPLHRQNGGGIYDGQEMTITRSTVSNHNATVDCLVKGREKCRF